MSVIITKDEQTRKRQQYNQIIYSFLQTNVESLGHPNPSKPHQAATSPRPRQQTSVDCTRCTLAHGWGEKMKDS
jgi:hypothetical protein